MATRTSIAGFDKTLKDGPSVTADGAPIQEQIDGVRVRRPPIQIDERGTICEVYDLRWGFTDDDLVYVYHVTILPGQVKGWVVHAEQNDRMFAYAGVLRIVLYDARAESQTFGGLNVFHFGTHDRALVSIPAGVFHAVKNVGTGEAAFINLPSEPYRHNDPDKHRLPLDNDVIPYRL